MFSPQKIFHGFILLFFAISGSAQESRPSPEAELMLKNARDYVARGNYKDAVITYRQAILLTPANVILYKELGNAQYLGGHMQDAQNTLSELLENGKADADCYRLLAAIYILEKKYKKAKSLLNKGLERFPFSGLLYHELGNVLFMEKKTTAAINAWQEGIRKDSAYSHNYYEAAQAYLMSGDVLWGLLYGEIYLNIEPDTTGTQQLKNRMFAAYKTMFDNMVKNDLPAYGTTATPAPVADFEGTVRSTYALLSPVVSDGINTENLTMLRTRFIIEWFHSHGSKYPFSLFSYMHDLIKNGYFDIYNEWLFGMAENVAAYNAWNQFHEGDMQRFFEWRSGHPFHPAY